MSAASMGASVFRTRSVVLLGAVALLGASGAAAQAPSLDDAAALPTLRARVESFARTLLPADTVPDERDAARTEDDSTSTAEQGRGRSGKLLARILRPVAPRSLEIPVLARLFGGGASEPEAASGEERDAAAEAEGHAGMPTLRMLPFWAKDGDRIGSYTVGFWPAERRAVKGEAYGNPEGFIEVTPENQDTRVSEHFRLRDFITHDQQDVWPKYVVLREELIDKLELVLEELEATGHPVNHVVVLSGFRHPSYNEALGEESGRSLVSRHQYGDAADIIIDNDGDGRMDDLNRDRRLDRRDVQVVLDAVNRVERRYPDLVGGVGLYRAQGPSGPFAHIDVRGSAARWTTFRSASARRKATSGRARLAAAKAAKPAKGKKGKTVKAKGRKG
ncbi:MAG TPA: hypothetical protein VFS05_13955 [Gemmatimonadaceae bacterium]|nr:hypothetical protein [Gemmatimonadaceae bacterium]